MRYNFWSKKVPGYLAIVLFIALGIYFIWDGMLNPGGGKILAGLCLILFTLAFTYIKRFDDRADLNTTRRIRAEFSREVQPQIFELYRNLQKKNLGELFPKILDDAHGDLSKAKELTGLAETVGWKEFLENHW